MSYLLDKQIKKKKTTKIIIAILAIIFVFYFRTGVFRGLSYGANVIFKPVLIFGKNLGNKFSSIGDNFRNKKNLINENENLKAQILQSEADRANYATVVDENNKLKEILGRKSEGKQLILGNILSKRNTSIYGSVIIDLGINDGIVLGQKVFALGNIPIGKIAEVDATSSKVILYSNPGERTEVVISGVDAFMEAVGRGGGNFEMSLPRDFILENGTQVVLPGLTSEVLGVVSTVISDPRDSFKKALLVSPVNIQELKFVEVEK